MSFDYSRSGTIKEQEIFTFEPVKSQKNVFGDPWPVESIVIIGLTVLIVVLIFFMILLICRYLLFLRQNRIEMAEELNDGKNDHYTSQIVESGQRVDDRTIHHGYRPSRSGQVNLDSPSVNVIASLSTKSLSTTTPMTQRSKVTLAFASSKVSSTHGPSSTLNVFARQGFIQNLVNWRTGRHKAKNWPAATTPSQPPTLTPYPSPVTTTENPGYLPRSQPIRSTGVKVLPPAIRKSSPPTENKNQLPIGTDTKPLTGSVKDRPSFSQKFVARKTLEKKKFKYKINSKGKKMTGRIGRL